MTHVDSPSPTETSAQTQTTALPGDGKLKRPTKITATLGYTDKPKRFMGLRVLGLFAIAIVLAILLRLLASPGGGPLMQAYLFVTDLFTGGSGASSP